ncbi:ATP-dependent Clp protease ATP-binding subunit, partial [Lactobacillus parabuchneri]|nr:ATP-dependent Clp protease ATP-binding subunit [Lentilactobacillus parabuchneri]
DNLQKIVSLMIDDVNSMLKQQGLVINVTDKAKAKLVELGYNPAMGARPLRRVIQEQIEDKVADFYLDHENAATLTADVDSKGNIVIKAP